jgi:hypothetical protein
VCRSRSGVNCEHEMLILCGEDGDELGRGGEGLILLDDEIDLIKQFD